MQTAYDSVHGPRVVAGSAHRVRADIRREQAGRWSATYRHTPWTLVWTGHGGLDERIDHPTRGAVVCACPARAWMVFAPGVSFADRIHRIERGRECLWAFFAVVGELPPLSGRPFTLVLDREQRIAREIRAMAAAQARGAAAGALAAHGHLLVALGHVLAAAGAGSGDERDPWRVPGDRPEPAGLLAQVDLHVARSLAAPPSRARLAAALGLSESSLAHRFRAETGMTLVERVRWLRIREAQALLAEPDASVKAVAAALGFSSAFWFSRVFREVAGTTPLEWMRRSGR